MMATCTKKAYVAGFGVVKKGVTIDITPEQIDEHVRANFVIHDGQADIRQDDDSLPVRGSGVLTIDELSRDELIRRLDELGIPYRARDTKQTLLDIYNNFISK